MSVLMVEDLGVDYGRGRNARRVVDGVGFVVEPGETVALVGESGSGKTTIGRAVMGMLPAAAGRVLLNGAPVHGRSITERRRLARHAQMIFQNPYGALNPSIPVGRSIAEPLIEQRFPRREIIARVAALAERVGLPDDALLRYPSHFSGGQRQRVGIARALSVSPDLVVCDEPTSALDVSTQARVVQLLQELQREYGVSYLFISHDLALVRELADRVLVLSGGTIVEHGTAAQVCTAPIHPYTQRLVASVPVPNPILQRERREAREAAIRSAPVSA